MKLVAGIDIGNATTETALARIEDGHAVFLASGTPPRASRGPARTSTASFTP